MKYISSLEDGLDSVTGNDNNNKILGVKATKTCHSHYGSLVG